ADRKPEARVAAGDYTPWLNLTDFVGDRFHGRLHRAGGVAEFPNLTADFMTEPPAPERVVVIELATAPRPDQVVKRWEESFRGSKTSFLVSPDLKQDADSLETAAEMTARRLAWAREATGGRRASPRGHIIQTSFWSPQRDELNALEAEVLRLLGFNVVGNLMAGFEERFPFRRPAHTHTFTLNPATTRAEIARRLTKAVGKGKPVPEAGVPFGLSDEICARPRIGDQARGRTNFWNWCRDRGLTPHDLGATRWEEVEPIETPEQFHERERENGPAARRIFYYTTRFRQLAGTERLKWHSDIVHELVGPEPWTTTLVADHPYFGGTGLGMGMVPNTTWGGAPLALDWFDLVRQKAVDLIGIEDWLGLQYMYGPNSTWEGFQLMGFQAAIMRSGGRSEVPIMAWITPSDETNLRLKSASALCQGAKHFFYWTYGPTATSTENYWSDLRGSYDGIAHITRQLAGAEPILSEGRMRKTRLALLYSISSDLWQPFGYIHMLERRCTYFALIHDHYLVDMLTEEDVEVGRLDAYDVLYTIDPCIKQAAMDRITDWVAAGGALYGACAAGSRNEFNEKVAGLSKVFGIDGDFETLVQKGRYRFRGGLNSMKELDQYTSDTGSFGVVATRDSLTASTGTRVGSFRNGDPGAVKNGFGKGSALYIGTSPGVAYARDAGFVAHELKEKWPVAHRNVINTMVRQVGMSPLLRSSHPVVEAGIYDHEKGTALVLANFTYAEIAEFTATLNLEKPCKRLRSMERGDIRFTDNEANGRHQVSFSISLGLNDILVFETADDR
ncbi:MAG: beta-galactosidase trimerization domain-containing protein, partial [Verrucomicrobiota bacterium]